MIKEMISPNIPILINVMLQLGLVRTLNNSILRTKYIIVKLAFFPKYTFNHKNNLMNCWRHREIMEKALNKCLAQAKESDTTITTQLQEGDPASVIWSKFCRQIRSNHYGKSRDGKV